MFELNAPVICLCGSPSSKDLFEKYYEEFSLKGYIVLMIGSFREDLTDEQLMRLNILQKWKITISNAIFVIDENSEAIKSEIEFAEILGIDVIRRNV